MVPTVMSGVFWMTNPIDHRYVFEVKRAHTLETGDVDAILVGVRTTSVVCVDAAFGAEIVFRHTRVKLIKAQRIFPRSEDDVA